MDGMNTRMAMIRIMLQRSSEPERDLIIEALTQVQRSTQR